MSKTLATVTRATRQRVDAEARYRAAIRAASDAGHSLSEIGKAAGLTRNGVRYLLNPWPKKARDDQG